MKNILSLLIIAVACYKITVSFINPDVAVTLFGSEINPWLYRVIWLGAALLSTYTIFKERNKKQKK